MSERTSENPFENRPEVDGAGSVLTQSQLERFKNGLRPTPTQRQYAIMESREVRAKTGSGQGSGSDLGHIRDTGTNLTVLETDMSSKQPSQSSPRAQTEEGFDLNLRPTDQGNDEALNAYQKQLKGLVQFIEARQSNVGDTVSTAQVSGRPEYRFIDAHTGVEELDTWDTLPEEMKRSFQQFHSFDEWAKSNMGDGL